MGKSPTTYWDYIKIEELLALQNGRDETDASLSNDEVLFITVHQIDELWFKLAIRELVHIRDLFATDHVEEQSLSAATRGLRRAGEVFRHLSEHFALMETMTTRDYLSFRDKLSPASGFQSAQLREIEILMGLQESDRVPLGSEAYMQALRYPDGRPSPASARVERRLLDLPSLKQALEDWLFRTPIDGSVPGDPNDDAVVTAFIDGYCEAMERDANTQRDVAIEFALTEQDATRLRQRYQKQVALAR
ncbi:MAG: tryptophan 2,3-dioxygenase family protein, partial [Nannocystaceae bacterium]